MNLHRKLLVLSLVVFICVSPGAAETETGHYRHSLETSPLSPMLQMSDKGIWAITYEYAVTPKDGLKAGLSYMNIYFDEGNSDSPGIILGYRRFLWRTLYVEYELWPSYDRFYESNEDRYYEGFDLWNEFRIGYQFNFYIETIPLFVNVAWPFGFGLYSANKPDSFYDRMDQGFGDTFFYHFPLVFTGIKF